MARTISIANQKGGASKTTTTVNFAAVLSFVLGKKILLIDSDPQGNLTDHLGFDIDDTDQPTIYEVLKGEVDVKDAILDYKGIDVLPADIALSSAEREFTQVGSEHRLKKALQPVMDDYDFILIDTPPSLGILTVNAFTVSDEIIVPVEAAYFSLKGLVKLNETIETVKEFTNNHLIVRGVLFTKFNEKYNISKEMVSSAEQISQVINAPIFDTRIRRTVKVDESQAAGVDLLSYHDASTAEEDYKAFAKEYLEKIGEIDG
ncbi:ParA family protein [Enterococcus pallens]|uniref:Sporulation initiation inhibitor protein Soj n=1 Tax=Enterococcus pallens ATCC BAA-351 TaxID=1158607 RepID=R2S0C6_9ENTE|nr:ParA family protein [Enterococcus pallens]EOH86266.1 chromosome partitioning protein [Enterococcus pallens ATCC BAA-351]EOU09410.1 chromosome partitioning protein [Enterococcus pallens ATCC BAA-351]OJG76412.1 chromosome partitioning protein [Enterococcus pallens]